MNFGMPRQKLVNHVGGYKTAYSQSLNRSGCSLSIYIYTDVQINDAIDQGLENGDYIAPLGPDGLIAISIAARPILMSVPDVYTSIYDVVAEVSAEYSYLYSGSHSEMGIIKRVYQMVQAGYLEANNKFEVRLSLNVRNL